MAQGSRRAAAALAVSLAASPALAGGFYTPEASARAVGRAFSSEAADSGAASLWWNPASIGPSGGEIAGDLSAIVADSQADDGGSTLTRFLPRGGPAFTIPVRGEPRVFGPVDNAWLASAAAAVPVGDRFVLGMSATQPFGFTTNYPVTSWARFGAAKSRLDTVDVQATAAWRINGRWTLGASADAQYADLRLTRLPFIFGPTEDRLETSGDGWAWGWSAGVLGRVGDVHLGVSYRSSLDHELKGDFAFSGVPRELSVTSGTRPARIAFSTPWIATAAVRWAVDDKATLGLQLQRFGWSEFEGFDVDADFVEDGDKGFTDTTSVAFGVDYVLSPGVTGRAGVQYDPTPTSGGITSLQAPDADRWAFGLGAGFTVQPAFLVDVSVAYVAFDDLEIDATTVSFGSTPLQATLDMRGEGDLDEVLMSVGASWRF
nr:outer membrane protein transport protein [Caulobacter sp. 17J80-11]